MTQKRWYVNISMLIIIAAVTAAIWIYRPKNSQSSTFSGDRAYQDVITQIELGPRTMGSEAHEQIIKWSMDIFRQYHWKTSLQTSDWRSHPIQNIVAERGKGHPWIVIGAHYDSRFIADHDANASNRQLPVPAANDGASGVSVLLELARVLPSKLTGTTAQKISLVLFDAEDNGNIQGWDWILGSRAYADYLSKQKDLPDGVIVVDMIGDSDLDIYMEKNSDKELTDAIWNQAGSLGYSQFIPRYKHKMLDDHIPFIQLGIRAVDIIDFDYPYYHSTEDTPDKVSAKSLQAVGETLRSWLTK